MYGRDPFDNLLMLTDSYKTSQYPQYPPKTKTVYSFFESRGGEFPTITFFGLQYFLKRYLEGVVVTAEKIAEAKRYIDAHMGPGIFNEVGWTHILTQHGGRLPIKIRAVREGSVITPRTTLITVENTDPACYWLTNYLETLLVQVWYPTTVATQSRSMKNTLRVYLEETGDPSLIDFKLHDFGFRGSTSVESAGLGGAAHLVNFKGTDTMAGLIVADRYYAEPMAGFSIPASEHSTITSWGREREVDAFANMLTQFPSGLVACVSDSYDIYKACSDLWGRTLKPMVLSRNGTLVVRPDSGTPSEIVPAVLSRLGDAFGYTTNAKGFKVLDPHVRVIQGDGINRHSMADVLSAMQQYNWSADNIAFGSGGGLLQNVNRDTCRFAFKCSAVDIDGVWHDVMKDPITDKGKVSRAGRFFDDALTVVFENGVVTHTQTFAEIRELAGKR